MYYTAAGSASWQLIEEEVNDDVDQNAVIDREVQYVWGLRYIDDIIMRRENTDPASDDDFDDKIRYYCTDVQFSPIAILDDAAAEVERISYTPYGVARHHPQADIDGDGKVELDDLLAISSNWGNFGVADIDRSGTVDLADQLAVIAQWHQEEPAGDISFPAEDNIIGYDGYVFDEETQGYCVRLRFYIPQIGRWVGRDPAGYRAGLNLLLYVQSNPGKYADPLGLDKFLIHNDDHGAGHRGNPGHFQIDGTQKRWCLNTLRPIGHDDFLTERQLADIIDQLGLKLLSDEGLAGNFLEGSLRPELGEMVYEELKEKWRKKAKGNNGRLCLSRKEYKNTLESVLKSVQHDILERAAKDATLLTKAKDALKKGGNTVTGAVSIGGKLVPAVLVILFLSDCASDGVAAATVQIVIPYKSIDAYIQEAVQDYVDFQDQGAINFHAKRLLRAGLARNMNHALALARKQIIGECICIED